MPNVYKPALLQIRPQYDPNPDTADHPENVLWFVSGTVTTPTLANLQAIQNTFDGAFSQVTKQVMPTTKSYTGSTITDWSSALGKSWSSVGTFSPVAGLSGADAMPLNVAVLISLHLPIRYKGGHPRIYLPWISFSASAGADGNKVLGTVVTAVASNYTAYEASMLASGTLGGQATAAYLFRNDAVKANIQLVSSFTVQTTFASQRRRLRRAAHH